MAGKTVNDLPYKRNEALEELMIAALRALRKAKHDQGTSKEPELLKHASDSLEHLDDHGELCYG
jgi:hypothetical protein